MSDSLPLPWADLDFWMQWGKCQPVLFRKCLALMNGDVFAAEDALSTAMLKAHEKVITFAERIYNFQSWALRLTENVCLDQLRKEKRLVCFDEVPESLFHIEGYDGYADVESDATDSTQEIFLGDVCELLRNLPCSQRGPALLRFLFSESYRDIARRLNITEANARKRVQTARETLRQHFGGRANNLFSSGATAIADDSSAMKKMWEEAASLLPLPVSELELSFQTAWLVNAKDKASGNGEVLVLLPFKPALSAKAFASLLQYIALHPDGWKRRLQLAQMLYIAGIFEKAEEEFRQILKKRPSSFSARLLLGNLLLDSGKRLQAAAVFEETTPLADRDSSKDYLSGMSAMCRGRPLDAIAFFERANELEPWNPTFNQAKGICLYRSGEYRDALCHFQNLLTARPHDVVSLAYSCELSIALDRPGQAVEYADRILRDNPEDLFALKRKSQLTGPQTSIRQKFQRGCDRLNLFARMLQILAKKDAGARPQRAAPSEGGDDDAWHGDLQQKAGALEAAK